MSPAVLSLAILLLSIASMGHVTAFAFHMTDVQRTRFTNLAAHRSREPSSSDRKHELSHLAVAAAIAMTMAASPFPAFADGAYGIRLCRFSVFSTNVQRVHVSRPISRSTGSTKEFKFPPIDISDKNRCVLQGSNMGQSNAARDKLYDLRQCQLSGADASGLDLSGVIMSKTDVSKAKFLETYFSKAYLRGACSVAVISSQYA